MNDQDFIAASGEFFPHAGGRYAVPNNSLALSSAVGRDTSSPGGGGGGAIAVHGNSSFNDERLTDKLLQVSLYELIQTPPSVSGDRAAAQAVFRDLDPPSRGAVTSRSVLYLLKAEDVDALSGNLAGRETLDFDEFVEFVEAAAARRGR